MKLQGKKEIVESNKFTQLTGQQRLMFFYMCALADGEGNVSLDPLRCMRLAIYEPFWTNCWSDFFIERFHRDIDALIKAELITGGDCGVFKVLVGGEG